MKTLMSYLKPYSGYIALCLIIKTFGALTELAIPYVLSHILDNVVPTGVIRAIIFWGAVMIICSLAACISNVAANRMAVKVARDTTRRLRFDLFKSTLSLSAAQIDAFTVPSLESRLTSDTYNVHHFVGMGLRMGVRAPILLIGGIAVTFSLDPVLTLVMIVIVPLIAAGVMLITTKGIPLFNRTQRSVDGMVRVVREDSQGIRVIKALSKDGYERSRFDDANKRLIKDETRASGMMAASNPLVTFLLNVGLVGVVLVGAFRVNGGLSQPGKIIAFIQYFTIISNAMIGITKIFVRYSKGAASAGRIEEVLNTELEIHALSGELYPERREDGYIVFDHVSFSYKGRKNNIDDVSFSLPKGGTLGIIGSTGSGKSTLVGLLMRFYDVDSGAVRIGGKDVRTYSPDALRKMFGSVMQNDFIFAGSVEENIDFGRGLSHDDIVRAAHRAQASEFIERYPDTYGHMLTSKGTNVSGGQKQRILISRAFAGDPDILVLDDSSSALDYKTDSALRKSIRREMSDTTTVVVAQRISSVMNCDLIIVLENGRIIGKGTHEELLHDCDVYREISDSQIGGALVD